MQFKSVIGAAALATLASAANTTVTTDVVVTDFTTYCPASTQFVVNNKTITVSEATTITITGECTIPTTYVTATEGTPSTVAEVSSFQGAGNKVAVGAAAGLAAVAALL